jgi:hypothetical protein
MPVRCREAKPTHEAKRIERPIPAPAFASGGRGGVVSQVKNTGGVG